MDKPFREVKGGVVIVLQGRSELIEARNRLRAEGLDYARFRPWKWYLLSVLKTGRVPPVPDARKGWDVWLCYRAISSELDADASILDIGSFNSEILRVLAARGYRRLCGIDLNPQVTEQPFGDRIRYETRDFYETGYQDKAFDAVTCISAIEHGFREEPFFREMSRIVKPGGLLLVTTDYSARKIDTAGKYLFGMPWKIFSREEVIDLLSVAGQYGFHADTPGEMTQGDAPVVFEGFAYTFIFLMFRKGQAE